jgi:hypothetical protein
VQRVRSEAPTRLIFIEGDPGASSLDPLDGLSPLTIAELRHEVGKPLPPTGELLDEVTVKYKAVSGLSGVELRLPGLSAKDIRNARKTVLQLHDRLGHAAPGKWHPTCSVQSEASALIKRNPDLFPQEILDILNGGGVKAMQVLYVLTLKKGFKLEEGKAIGSLLMKGNVEERDRPLRFVPPDQIRDAIRRAGTNSPRSLQRVYVEARRDLGPILQDAQRGGDLEALQVQSAVVFRRLYEKLREIGRRASGLQELRADTTLYREEERWFRSAVREEIRYWNTFLAEVQSGTAKNIPKRFDAYIDALRFMYEAARIATMPDNVLLHWMGPRDERLCAGCSYMLEMSPFTKDNIPAVPRDGMTNCLTHCRHHIVVRVASDLNEVVRRRQQLPRRDKMVRALKERLRRKGRSLAAPQNPFRREKNMAPVSRPIPGRRRP